MDLDIHLGSFRFEKFPVIISLKKIAASFVFLYDFWHSQKPCMDAFDGLS